MENVVNAGVMGRKLINYLPYQIREFKEYKGITTGEQPEFELAWNYWQEVFDNQYIDTAGDYGLSRWEKMLGITPKATDTLKARRIRIKTRLNNFIPYTFRVFMRMMNYLADGEPFEVYLDPGTYLMRFVLQWGTQGKIESLEWLIQEILPENIAIDSKNEIPCEAEGMALTGGGVCFAQWFLITNDGEDRHTFTSPAFVGGGVVAVGTHLITNDSREQMEATGAVSARGGVVHAICPVITNDSVEAFTMEGTAHAGAGAVNSVVVMLTNDFQEGFSISGPDGMGGGSVTTEFIQASSEEERDDL